MSKYILKKMMISGLLAALPLSIHANCDVRVYNYSGKPIRIHDFQKLSIGNIYTPNGKNADYTFQPVEPGGALFEVITFTHTHGGYNGSVTIGGNNIEYGHRGTGCGPGWFWPIDTGNTTFYCAPNGSGRMIFCDSAYSPYCNKGCNP